MPRAVVPDFRGIVVPARHAEGSSLLETDALKDAVERWAKDAAITDVVDVHDLQRVADGGEFLRGVVAVDYLIHVVEASFVTAQVLPDGNSQILICLVFPLVKLAEPSQIGRVGVMFAQDSRAADVGRDRDGNRQNQPEKQRAAHNVLVLPWQVIWSTRQTQNARIPDVERI